MRRWVLPALLAAAAALTGCIIPLSLTEWRLGPEGETVKVASAPGRSLSGELLGMRGERLVVLSGGRLVELTLPADAEVEVEGYPAVKVGEREKLRLYARYPQGLSDELWGELLRHQGQSSFDPVPAR